MRFLCRLLLLSFALAVVPAVRAAENTPHVYVLLWFDTEDYLLPASDDAALHLADFLTQEKVPATFKVVGEKARTLERRGRSDVIAALKKHEIGYHSNFHSIPPTPAQYLSPLGWEEGVNEFDRRERPGYDDLQRIFGQTPTCYGQPGSSWGPQVFGAMHRWGMPVYLDAGSHVRLEDRPFYYGGILNLYKLAYVLRADLMRGDKGLQEAEDRFVQARQKLLAEGGGVVSIYYHPCEFVHKEFWDGVNFRAGANPPREQWKLPPQKTPEETKAAYQVFESYVQFMKRFPEVRFITASQAARIYHDRAREHKFTAADIKALAAGVSEDVTFQQRDDYTLSASEVFALLNEYVAAKSATHDPQPLTCASTPYGPDTPTADLDRPFKTDWSQFARTTADVAGYLRKQGHVPPTVWLGSTPVPPESYLVALAHVAGELADGNAPPETVELRPAHLAAAEHVSKDRKELWGWVIFPPGFRAPEMMELARRQAWTLKPALLDGSVE